MACAAQAATDCQVEDEINVYQAPINFPVSKEGQQQRVGELYSEVPWNHVNEVAETPDYVFVEIDGLFSDYSEEGDGL